MTQGKHICAELKQIRRTIAEENGIALEIPECTFEGECSGTCPRCEAEMRYLENQLAKRLSLGKVATVAGLMLTLASPAAAQTDKEEIVSTTRKTSVTSSDTGYVTKYRYIKGILKDAKTQRPISSTDIIIETKGLQYFSTTDSNGMFSISQFPINSQTMEVWCRNYKTITIDVPSNNSTDTAFSIALTKDLNSLDAFDTKWRGTIEIETNNNAKKYYAVRKHTAVDPSDVMIGGITTPTLPGTRASESGDDQTRQIFLKPVDPQHQGK